MYSWTNRISTILTDAISILGAMAILFAISSYFLMVRPNDLKTNVDVKQLVKFNRLDYIYNYRHDRASFIFDMDTDLRPLFHWNVKVVVAYLYAEYKTEKNEFNQVILWDKIFRNIPLSKEKALLKFPNLKNKYSLIDLGNQLKGKDVTLKLRWNVVPYVGLLYDQEVVVGNYKLPERYQRDKNIDLKVYDEYYDPNFEWA
ncbi:hypothetical protein ABK040_009731 [Willaertia magna]